jgi:hypothetical protein
MARATLRALSKPGSPVVFSKSARTISWWSPGTARMYQNQAARTRSRTATATDPPGGARSHGGRWRGGGRGQGYLGCGDYNRDHVGIKSIAATGDGDDELLLRLNRSQRLSDEEDTLRQITLFDEGVAPDRLHQVFLRQQAPGVAHHVKEQVEGSGGERNGVAGTREDAIGRVHFEPFKSV